MPKGLRTESSTPLSIRSRQRLATIFGHAHQPSIWLLRFTETWQHGSLETNCVGRTFWYGAAYQANWPRRYLSDLACCPGLTRRKNTLASVPSSQSLERQSSAPSGPISRSPPMHPTYKVGPIGIPKQQGRRASAAASLPLRSSQPGLPYFNQAQSYTLPDYLARSPEDRQGPAISLSPSPAVERGELHYQDISHLTPYSQAIDSDSIPTPMTATSETSLTSASTATSEPMTRSNTNDVCHSLDMFRVNSQAGFESRFEKDDAFFSLSPDMVLEEYDGSSVPLPPFSYVHEVKHSLSQESYASSDSLDSSQSLSSLPVQEERRHSRPLAPKMQRDPASSSASRRPKMVTVTAEDGTTKCKAEIARIAPRQPQRKTIFCQFCHDQPQGFHGEHELRRHVDRQHTQRRRVWICKEKTPHGNFLSNCKACRNHKTYGANYNAAAHLRRAHFNPCKNKRGWKGQEVRGSRWYGRRQQPRHG